MAKILFLDNSILSQDKKYTYLAADYSSGTALTVQSITGFGTGKIVLIGEIGQEEAEINQTHTVSSPSGTTVYLNSALTYAHSVDTKLYITEWNQFEVTWAATATGTKSTLTYGTALQADSKETQYADATKTSGYYFIRFVDTVGSAYSDYSDPIPYGGFADNTVWAIKDRALKKIDAKIDNLITHDWLNECLWEARREYHNAPGKRPFRKKFNQDIGDVATGTYRIEAPSDLEDPSSARNIFGVRIGQGNIVNFYDKKDFDDDYRDVAHTTLLSPYNSTAATHLSLTNARDFDSSGSVDLEDDTITYSAKDNSTGSLTISVAGVTTHTAGVDVWQGISFGLPLNYTLIKNAGETAYIYFNCPFETAYTGQNVWMDYYRTLVVYDSDADELDEPDYDMYVSYLAWRIKKRLKPDLDETKDSDFIEWMRRKQIALNNEYLGVTIQFTPDIPNF